MPLRATTTLFAADGPLEDRMVTDLFPEVLKKARGAQCKCCKDYETSPGSS